ncbi:MAG: 16S rRNA (cytosine(1402)-N(4))-methyltransferase, partial [Planctomycetota bacterium]
MLLREVVDLLALREGLVVVDGTVGAGGHARAIVPHIGPTGILVGLDRDSEILGPARAALAEATAAGAGPRISLHHCAHSRMHEALASIGQSRCDRVLLDLGVSSMQLDRPDRGFSFMADGPLDMRMDASAPDSAADWLAVVGERELAYVQVAQAGSIPRKGRAPLPLSTSTADAQGQRRERVPYPRGAIVDRRGNLLAVDC